jgi:periplasmic divalent cation tolerance protein
MEKIIQVTTTTESREAAVNIGRQLVEKRLVACAQVAGPILSIYWWQGRMEETEEWFCVVKTRQSLYQKVEHEIKELHPYELPEIVGTAIDRALQEYANWVTGETVEGP